VKTVLKRSLAADVAIMTWTSTQTCPITKGPTKVREVERTPAPTP